MSKEMNFGDDPIFKELRKFSNEATGPESMPAEIFEAFRSAKPKRARKKWLTGSVFGILFAAIALPSLSYAGVLPDPIARVVERVAHVIAAPVRVITNAVNPVPATPTMSPSPIATTSPTLDSNTSSTSNVTTNSTTPTPSPTHAPVTNVPSGPVKSKPVAPSPDADTNAKSEKGGRNSTPTNLPSSKSEEVNHGESEGAKNSGGNAEHSNEGENKSKATSPAPIGSKPAPPNAPAESEGRGTIVPEKGGKSSNSEEKSNKE